MDGERGQDVVLEVDGLSKRYGATQALADVSFGVRAGQVLAVLGQNGAGKSTLVKILAGVTGASAGSIRVGGEDQEFGSARDALKTGVVLIPQELAYVRDLSVAENILLGSWAARRNWVSPRRLREAAAPFAEEVGLGVPLSTPMSRLSLAQCQLVEIAKALSRQARVLLLDEPTAALSNAETASLLAAVGRLRDRGVAMLYISHRLDEVLATTDHLLVLRDGGVAASRPTTGATRAEIIERMLGHAPDRADEPPLSAASGRPSVRAVPTGPSPSAGDERLMLETRDVRHHGRGLRGVSLQVQRGEVVGLFGLAGSGHDAAALMLAGQYPHDAGELYVRGTRRPPLKSSRQARNAGIMYVPPDRKSQGLILGQSIRRNVAAPQLGRLGRWGLTSAEAEERLVQAAADRMSLRYHSSGQAVQELSGGNQQKVLLASRIYADPDVLVIQEPTRGVDVAARDEIHELLRQLAQEQRCIVFASSDVEEAVDLSTRLLVFRDGQVRATLVAGAKTQANALEAAGKSEREV